MTRDDNTPQAPEPIRRQALQQARKRHKNKDLEIVRTEVGEIPSSGRSIFRFELAKADVPNGPRHSVVLDEDGEPVDLAALEVSEELPIFVPADRFLPRRPVCPGQGRVTVDPVRNDLVLKPGERFEETIHVTVPADFGVPRTDVYLLCDTTGSMQMEVEALQAAAQRLVSRLLDCPQVAVGVGNYQDFPFANSEDDYAFQHQLAPTNGSAAVLAAIDDWSVGFGGDGPEAQLYALYRLATDPAVGWRPGAKRLVVWIGDRPGHEPICQQLDSSLPGDLHLGDVIAALRAARVTVLALDLGDLDGDPTAGADDYPCVAGGDPGQASAIAAATGGLYRPGVTTGTLAADVYNVLTTVFRSVGEIGLQASGAIGLFVASITPSDSYGPFAGGEERTLPFAVELRGTVPCRDDERVYTGAFDVLCGGVVVARKPVRVTVPACLPDELHVYSVKFVCGVQRERGEGGACTVRPGVYATEINIHNFQDVHACIDKRVLPVVFCGAPVGREPRHVGPRAEDRIVLPPGNATMDDCCRIGELLFGGSTAAGYPLTVGFLEIVSSVELQVTAVYTVTAPDGGPVSIDVEEVTGRTKRRRREPGTAEVGPHVTTGTEVPL